MKRKLSEPSSGSRDANQDRLSKLLFNRPLDVIKDIKIKSEDDIHNEDLKPAWIDEDDELFTANQVTDTKRKDAYSDLLKQKYVSLMGTPNWANLKRKAKHDSDDDDDDQILRTVGHLDKTKPKTLSKNRIELKRFPKINSETGNEGPIIKALEFHPKTNVALVGGQSGIFSLFSIGGDKNPKLHSVALPKFRLLNARFTPDGSDALISSDINHHYYNYNLIQAKATLVSLPKDVRKPTVFELSSCGKYLAVADGFDEIHILCAASKELLRSLKQNSKVEAITFSADSKKIYSFGSSGSVTVWDLQSYRVEHKFMDHGCVTGSCISVSPCGRLLATGSGEGIVNIYESSALTVPQPIPIRTIDKLTTKITCVKFNASSEILGLSSAFYPNAIKLVHIPSYQIFSNFPEPSSKFNQIASFSFSPNSGFMGLSNNKNSAYLYRLKHYQNY